MRDEGTAPSWGGNDANEIGRDEGEKARADGCSGGGRGEGWRDAVGVGAGGAGGGLLSAVQLKNKAAKDVVTERRAQ